MLSDATMPVFIRFLRFVDAADSIYYMPYSYTATGKRKKTYKVHITNTFVVREIEL